MDKVLDIYSYILKEHLSKCFANQQFINPVDLNKERFQTKAVFTATIIFLKSNPKIDDYKIVSATNCWLKSIFAEENLFSFLIENSCSDLKNLIDNNLVNFIGAESIDVATLYENLLGIESCNESTGIEISNSKNYRNKLGSYYTPSNLARSVTEKAIDTFFELNFGIKRLSVIGSDNLSKEILEEIFSVSFADFSCGAGNFLIEILFYFETLISKLKIDNLEKESLLKKIVLNISAFDVDCLALEVAKLSLLLRIRQPSLYKSLKANFVHANFLLHSTFVLDELKKIELFSRGYIYHEQLGVNKDILKKYDIVLGNPPWEKIRFEEKRFYALYENTIANNHFKASRTIEINEIELKNVQLAEFSKQFKREIEKAKQDLKQNSFFSLSNKGELNTYTLFTDAAIKLKTTRGVVGLVLKSSIVTSQVNQKIFKYLTKGKFVVAIYDFINRKKIFNIDSRERFCFLLLGNSLNNKIHISMNLGDVDEIEKAKSEIELSYKELLLLNPFTGMLPNFSTKKEADFLLRISYDFPFFKNVFEKVRFGRIVHFTSHANYISKKKSIDNEPIYEGKFFNQYDGKFSGFNGLGDDLRYGNKSSSVTLDEAKKSLSDYFPESRFFIKHDKWVQLSKNHNEDFMLAWRSLTSATNKRTCIATVLPFIPASQSVQFLTTNYKDLLYLAGLFNSIVFDFILKKKLSGIDLTQSLINQMPVPNIERINCTIVFDGHSVTIKQHISIFVSLLLKNDVRLNPLFDLLEFDYQYRNNESRAEIIRKIDLLFMWLYDLDDSEVKLVHSSFSKQYSNQDLVWFRNNLETIRSNNSVGSTISSSTSLSPVR